ncbi:MAG: glycoside hydrolase family 97 catalytic domain-containing protein [Bacteroidales bacterium]|nr:glycoside hydrolase family 97 catalytic domain-containing protein [Bacteroidales bacterium]
MNRFSAIIALAIGCPMVGQADVLEQFSLQSPDQTYEFRFTQEADARQARQMYYEVKYLGKTVVEKSALGVIVENQYFENALGVPNDNAKVWGENLSYIGQDTTSVDEVWTPPYGENATIRNRYNVLTLKFKKGEGNAKASDLGGYNKERTYFMNLEVRAYNEGIAFRYHFPLATNGLFVHITGEQTQFSMPAGTRAYYEKWAQGPYSLLPLENWAGECERPLTMSLPDDTYVCLAEAGVVDFVRTKFELDTTKQHTLHASMYDCADIITPYNCPWRVVMAVSEPKDLMCREELLLNLNEPCRQEDISYIKPGKVIRACQLNQKAVLEYIDFAARKGLQYVHLDAGWYGPEWDKASDATQPSPQRDLDMKAICQYARQKGIGVWVYVNQRALVNQLDAMLPVYKEWGLAGIKFGFVQIGNQHWTTWLHEAVAKCARYQLMVDIHDEYRPTGVSRTYPHLMTQEGVGGNEEFPEADHNVTLAFTRMVAGPADYTPCYYSRKIKTTHAHQLALPVVLYSPIQFLYWYDNPADCKDEAENALWAEVPTSWDESLPLAGEIGKYAAIARRSGEKWYVGVLNGKEARTLTLPTTFLDKKQKYRVTRYEGNKNLNTRTNVQITTMNKFKGGKNLEMNLEESGGAVFVIEKL